MKNKENFLLQRGSHHMHLPDRLSKHEWNTREGTGKSMKNAVVCQKAPSG